MDVQGKIGQRLVVGFSGYHMPQEYIRIVEKYKVANVILFAENIESAAQLRALCVDIQALVKKETGYPAFITIDQEGGVVTRLSESFAAVVPSAMAIAATGDPKNAYLAGRLTGCELNALGINFNLAPDMDVNSNAQNPVIGVRSYGDTPQTVAQYGAEMIRGLLDGGVLCAAKHFPGHGDTAVDSHLSLPVVNKSMEELRNCELLPFRAAIAAGVSAVMTTHILFPQLETENLPATMSRALITGLLRETLGFQGLVISDCMMMSAIREFYGTVNGCVAAIGAGVDLVFTSHSLDLAAQACQTIQQKLEKGELSMAEMDASVALILHYKRLVSEMPAQEMAVVGCAEHREFVRGLMERSLTVVHAPNGAKPALGNHPLFLGSYPFRPTLASNPEVKGLSFPNYMARLLSGEALITPVDPTPEEIAQIVLQVHGHSSAVLGTYNGHIKQGQLALARTLCETGVPTICVALRNPYDLFELPENIYMLAAYEYDENSLQAVAKALKGDLVPAGRLSVKH